MAIATRENLSINYNFKKRLELQKIFLFGGQIKVIINHANY